MQKTSATSWVCVRFRWSITWWPKGSLNKKTLSCWWLSSFINTISRFSCLISKRFVISFIHSSFGRRQQPFVKTQKEIRNATVMGELRVSKYLLGETVLGAQVEYFRPGYLENTDELPQALEASDYRYSCSTKANNALKHMPFRLNCNHRAVDETSVFQFLISIEDEALPLMGSRLTQAIVVAVKVQRYGGLFVVLSHPDILGHKLEFTRGLVERMKPTAWFSTLGAFG